LCWPIADVTMSRVEGDDKLALSTVDSLSEATGVHLAAGRIPEAVTLLRQALTAYKEDALLHGESPPSMIACSAIHLLLCTALSHGGCHDLAFQEAEVAAAQIDELWGNHLLPGRSQVQGSDAPGIAEASMDPPPARQPAIGDHKLFLSFEAGKLHLNHCRSEPVPEATEATEAVNETDLGVALQEFLLDPPPWLVRAVELAVQARQCAAIELEFMKNWKLEEEGPDGSDSGIDEAALYKRLLEQIVQLHTEAIQLSRELLEESHPVRRSTEHALQLWLARCPTTHEIGPALDFSPQRQNGTKISALAHILAGQSGPMQASDAEPRVKPPELNVLDGEWKRLPPSPVLRPQKIMKMPKHERYYQGLPPSPTWTSPTMRRKCHSMGSLDEASDDPRFDLDTETLLSNSVVSPPLSPSSKIRRSDTFLRGDALKALNLSPNKSFGRSPISFDMGTAGGKASWAVRKVLQPKRNARGMTIVDPFEEWLSAQAGPKKTLGSQVIEVMESDKWMTKWRGDLANQSRLFKNFWLKVEVDQDNLFEDRTRFSSEGIRTFKRSQQKYPKLEPLLLSPPKCDKPLSKMFEEHGVPLKNAEPNLKSLSGLLRQSHKRISALQKPKQKPPRLTRSKQTALARLTGPH
jgi:hypothetical protein